MISPDKKDLSISVCSRTSSGDSTVPSLNTSRVTRFAEATSVESPIELSYAGRLPFSPLPVMTNHYQPQPQPADVGFGYIGDNSAPGQSGPSLGVEMPASPRSPLKSALKTSNTMPRNTENPLSPTFKEEQLLDRREESTEKEQAKDLKVKVRVRLAKMVLRSTNFACSLIVLTMLSSTFSIFNATRSIPPRNNLPPWAQGTNPWPQITLLAIACVSLFMSVVVLYGYSRGSQKRAQKAALYYTTFSVAFFTFSIIMWGIGAGILQTSKTHGSGQDIWGWSCKDNTRKELFQADVSYSLICRFQNWSLVCALIEVVVETITIFIYGIVFYRFYSKRRLRKSMAHRDAARSELYLAQSRLQSAANTPGFAPLSARDGGYNPLFSPRFAPQEGNDNVALDEYSQAEEGKAQSVRYLSAEPSMPKPFTLQAPPMKGTPKMQQQKTFGGPTTGVQVQASIPEGQELRVPVPLHLAQPSPRPLMSPAPMTPHYQSTIVRTPAAPGEMQYAEVPIPAAYLTPMKSPPLQQGYAGPRR